MKTRNLLAVALLLSVASFVTAAETAQASAPTVAAEQDGSRAAEVASPKAINKDGFMATYFINPVTSSYTWVTKNPGYATAITVAVVATATAVYLAVKGNKASSEDDAE